MAPVALVTGGGNGIGAGIASALADEYDVVVFERDPTTTSAAAAHFAREGISISCLAVDVADPAAVADAVRQIVLESGAPEVLVNCAAVTGLPAKTPFLQTTDAQVQQIMAVNATGAFVCAREVARHMVARRRGVIVNVGSIAAHRGQLDAAAYTMSKAALSGLTRALALELGPAGVRVIQVDPGDIATATSQALVDAVADDRVRPGVSAAPPIGRRGTPADIAGVVRFLCSPQAGFVSGTSLVVDGGYLAG